MTRIGFLDAALADQALAEAKRGARRAREP